MGPAKHTGNYTGCPAGVNCHWRRALETGQWPRKDTPWRASSAFSSRTFDKAGGVWYSFSRVLLIFHDNGCACRISCVLGSRAVQRVRNDSAGQSRLPVRSYARPPIGLPEGNMALLLRDQVYQSIKSDILSGRYHLGERLLVDELATEYQVSKTPAREALSTLQNEGLITIISRVGYFVAHMTVKEAQDLFDLRLILETASAEMAARKATEQDLSYLENVSCTYVLGDVNSHLQYLKDNREFHYRLALATGNNSLAEAVGSVLDQMHSLLFLEARLFDRAEQFQDEHHQLVQALRNRDSEESKRAMVEAIENSRRAMLDAIMRGARLPISSSSSIGS